MEASTIISLVLGAAIGGGIMYFICRSTSQSVDISNNLISNSDAIALLNNHRAVSSGSVSGHLSIDVLLSYLDFVSTTSDNISTPLSGIEFYFAKYGKTDNREESNQMTFFLYPTTKIEGEDVPFDPVASSSGNIVKLVDIMRGGNHQNNQVALNRSHMSPPRGNTII